MPDVGRFCDFRIHLPVRYSVLFCAGVAREGGVLVMNKSIFVAVAIFVLACGGVLVIEKLHEGGSDW